MDFALKNVMTAEGKSYESSWEHDDDKERELLDTYMI
jgi:hypothetical protein